MLVAEVYCLGCNGLNSLSAHRRRLQGERNYEGYTARRSACLFVQQADNAAEIKDRYRN